MVSLILFTDLSLYCVSLLHRSVEAENECSRGKPPGPCHARVTQEEGLTMRHIRAKVKTQPCVFLQISSLLNESTGQRLRGQRSQEAPGSEPLLVTELSEIQNNHKQKLNDDKETENNLRETENDHKKK